MIKNYFTELKIFIGGEQTHFIIWLENRNSSDLYTRNVIIKLDDIEILEAINQLKEEKGNKYDVNLVNQNSKPIKLLKEIGDLKRN